MNLDKKMPQTVEEELEDYIWGKVKQQDYLVRVVKSESLAVDSILKKVSHIDDTLNRQLRKGVEENLSRLLEQTTALEALDKTQRGVHSEMNDVFEGCDRFAKNLDGQLLNYKNELDKFDKLVKLGNILSDAIRCEDLMEMLDKRTEVVKRSEIVCEIRGILEDCPELLNLSWLKETLTTKLKSVESEVRRAAADDLRRALVSLNASLVASSTKALSNLGSLEAELEVQLAASASEVDTKLSELATTPDSSRLLPATVNLIHSLLEQYVMLGATHLAKFAEKLARIIRTRVPLDAPFTLRFVQQMGRVLQSRPECSLGPLNGALRPMRTSLVSHSLQRLHEIIHKHDFSSVHANAFVDVLHAAIEEELAKVEWDSELRDEMQRNIRKCIDMVAKRFELETKLEPDTLLFGDRLNAVQLTNYRLLMSAHTLSTRWPAHSSSLVSYQNEVLNTILKAIRASISTILSRMHQETLGGKEESPYMQELCSFISRVLVHFSHMGGALQQSMALPSLCDFITEQFVIRATLIRPVTDGIRQQLYLDFQRLLVLISELGPGSYFPDPVQLGSLFTAECSTLPDNTPIWARVHILIADSPSVLVSPHASVDWSIDDYVSWCLEHNEIERLSFLNTLLASYASSVVSRGEKEYVVHYPEMLKLLKKGMKV